MLVTKYRINYENITHEELSLSDMNQYIQNNELGNIDIEEIQFDIEDTTPLRILEVLDLNYYNLFPARLSKIDIRKHLKPNLSLKKIIGSMVNGRPNYADYMYVRDDGSYLPIARITFEFTVDPSTGLCTRRKEILSFYDEDNDIHPENTFIISDEIYNPFNPDGSINEYDLLKMAQENELTLENIINDIKMKVNSYLVQKYMALGETYIQAKKHGADLFYKYSKEITTYIATGSNDFELAIQNDTEFNWLDDNITPSATIRQFIISNIHFGS